MVIVSMISINPLPLDLFHLELIDNTMLPNEVPLDLFPLEESLKEFPGAYTKFPSYHHKRRFPYCLNICVFWRIH